MGSLSKKIENCGMTMKELSNSVRTIAGQINAKTHDRQNLDDFVQIGWLGVINALETHNHRKGKQNFYNYVGKKIRGAIIDYMRKEDVMPRYARRKWAILTDVKNRLKAEMHFNPTDENVIKESGIPETEYRYLTILFTSYPEIKDFHNEHYNVKIAVNKLPDVQKQVIKLIYYEGYEKQYIAKNMGCTPSNISHIHNKALESLKKELI